MLKFTNPLTLTQIDNASFTTEGDESIRNISDEFFNTPSKLAITGNFSNSSSPTQDMLGNVTTTDMPDNIKKMFEFLTSKILILERENDEIRNLITESTLNRDKQSKTLKHLDSRIIQTEQYSRRECESWMIPQSHRKEMYPSRKRKDYFSMSYTDFYKLMWYS